MAHRVWVELADATAFDPMLLFGVDRFDRVVISYALSMIPEWKMALQLATHLGGHRRFTHDLVEHEQAPVVIRDAHTAALGLVHAFIEQGRGAGRKTGLNGGVDRQGKELRLGCGADAQENAAGDADDRLPYAIAASRRKDQGVARGLSHELSFG